MAKPVEPYSEIRSHIGNMHKFSVDTLSMLYTHNAIASTIEVEQDEI